MKSKILQGSGRTEAIAIISFFIVLFFLTIIATQASAQVNGNSGYCREFNGNSSRVTFASNDLNLSTGSTMTVTAWVKCISTTNEGSWANLVTLNNSTTNGDDGQFWLQHSQDNTLLEFAVENVSGARAYVQSTTAPVNGQWYHVAGVYDGSNVKIYVNGVLEASAGLTGKINSFNSSSYTLNFGQWGYSGNSYRRFNGDIDEVTIWNTALTLTQIRANMCKMLQGTESGLVGYWRMNEASGNDLYDMTANARKGKSNGATNAVSGAPIGNASSYTYGGTSLSLSSSYGDSLMVNTFSSAPTGVQIYRIDTMPNYTSAPSGYSVLATNYYYGVFIVGSSSPTYNVNYYYNGNPLVTLASLFGLAKRTDNTSSTWTDVNATLNSSINAFQKTAQSGRQEYIPALTTGGLPITLVDFTAVPVANKINIKWTTANEINNAYFTIERTADGINYETIATVKGAGNSDQNINYAITDNNPLNGTSYYRLTQTDYDGKSKTFNPVAVKLNAEINSGFTAQNAYPNPFGSSFTVNFQNDNTRALTIEIFNMNGMSVDKETINCPKGAVAYVYTKGDMLAAGTYLIVIADEVSGQKTVERVVKR